MPESTREPVQSNLREVAQLLREARHLDADAQQELADLMEELASVVAAAPAETSHLAGHAAQLAHALHQQHDTGLLSSAKRRLEESARRAEAEAPVASGIVRRLLDTLANLGI